MARSRTEGVKFDRESLKQYSALHRDDFKRTMLSLSDEQLKVQFRKAVPNMPYDMLEKVIQHARAERQSDPLSLLQEGLLNGKGGQITFNNLSPNFEMSLFIAQMTGSVVITDDKWRRTEYLGLFKDENELIPTIWGEIAETITNQEYRGSLKGEHVFDLRSAGRLGQLRKALHSLSSIAQTQADMSAEELTAKLRLANTTLEKALVNAQTEVVRSIDENGAPLPDAEQYQFGFKLEPIIPPKGIYHTNVHRMLLTYGSSYHMQSVPMAFFATYPHSNHEQDLD